MLADEIDGVAAFVREQAAAVDVVIVTGGLGGTPDDVTREAISAAFGVPQVEQPEVAARLRARFARDPDYAARWAMLPQGSRPLEIPIGGAPGFAIQNVYVLPGLPPRWRRCSTRSRTRSGRRADRNLAADVPDDREPDRRRPRGDGPPSPGRARRLLPELRGRGPRSRWSSSPPTAAALAAAIAWIEPELEQATTGSPPNGGGFRAW